jgi:beta-phosphoglucomutase-like phosphatase (HAD superfamily)
MLFFRQADGVGECEMKAVIFDMDAIVSSEDVVHRKLAPDTFLAAARKLGLSAA